jgi:hypothetical protein
VRDYPRAPTAAAGTVRQPTTIGRFRLIAALPPPASWSSQSSDIQRTAAVSCVGPCGSDKSARLPAGPLAAWLVFRGWLCARASGYLTIVNLSLGAAECLVPAAALALSR